ncbi:[citrate (pro-3S)-lyase] ligase [Propionivibrio sp.]|uniref:[citrate (pro-3S)-lyase] ligase n=1 Tax=Propionivibrio sp. TaxID=2212460 RepID=UPI002603C063|nr:[citrate (pro-3S)-lyase] ligase [Propionivibrio sp.]
MIVELTSGPDIAAAKNLIKRNGLSFEEGFDELFGIHESDELVAVGARAGNILKMLIVEPSHQGGPLLGEMATALVSRGLDAGFESLFIYTKPEYVRTFEALNFTLLANQGRAALLEYGNGLRNWLAAKRSLVRTGMNGAVVMNCNPFTKGHLYLAESAARQVDNLYLFVVREDRSLFPFDVRFRLVQEGVRNISNVILLDTSRYIVSGATFPTYFLKQDDPVARIQMELDITLFSSRIAPFFGITRRFVGTEPNCKLTNSYNDTMKRLLPDYAIELVEIERKEALSGVISASRVRELMARNELAQLDDYVPASTLAFLASEAAEPIRRQLQFDMRR